MVVNGAMAFDNIFMINGVDVNDNLFAQPQNLFIEDAIEETQVLTAGISAEYGRFTGGVVNAITKSGGNTFTGSAPRELREPGLDDRRRRSKSARGRRTPRIPNQLQERYEGTLGGPILKDHLWFFSSGRYQNVNTPQSLPQTGVSVPSQNQNKRFELKLTGTVAPGHTLSGGYLTNATNLTNSSTIQSLIIDPRSEENFSEPNNYFYTNYKGVLGDSLLVEAQYSQRHFAFLDAGGTSTAITDSPFFALNCACIYNAPYFDATDPENRNNKQLTGSVTKYWKLHGRHETKSGYEWFRSQRTGGNSQSSTSYVFDADFATDAGGTPLLDSSGRLIPMFIPGTSFLDYYPAVRGAVLNVDNNSAYAQDHWTISDRLSADIGARFEHVKAVSTGSIVSVDTSRIVPRVGVAYDINGNGEHIVHVNYGQYSGRYDEAQIGANSPVGNPADITPIYRGPAGQGVNFAPGFDLANYPINSANATVLDPTQNVKMDPNLQSPLVHEFTVSYGTRMFGTRGYARGQLHRPRHARPHRGLPDAPDRRHRRHGQRDQRRALHQPALHERAERPGLPEVSGAGVPVAVPHHRQLEHQRAGHGAAPELRQLRRRGHQRARQHVADRQLSRRRSTPRGRSRLATFRTSSAIACGSGASTTGRWDRAAP